MKEIRTSRRVASSLLGVIVLTIALLVNSVSVQAATFSATANSTWKQVKVSYSNCYPVTYFYLDGYEQHSTTGQCYHYSRNSVTTLSGSQAVTFTTDEGYVFLSCYNNDSEKVYLTAKVVCGGTTKATMHVTQ